MTTDILPMGVPCGTLCPEMATKTGLIPGTPVAVSVIDAHAALPAVGIKGSGALLMSMGTSLCHIMVSEKEAMVPGISGVVEEGILPGLYGYEAGQSAVGDIFQWFVENFPGAALESEAKAAGVNLFDMITKNAASLAPGESGLIALDWWNGNRSLLGNSGLRGMILGLSLQTRPEEVYRCLVEATAFGARTILENFISHGVPVETIYACGGLPRKSPLVMQIYADVLGRDIHISNITQAAAYGAAMYAMVALGAERGGYDTVEDAVDHLICPSNQCYHPSPENHAVYDRLFAVYQTLHDYFGREHPEIMAALNPQAGKDRKKNG